MAFSLCLLCAWWELFNNYWTRLSKISWFVSGEQINYMPKPNLRDPDKSRYFAITEFNICVIIRSPFFWSTKYVKSLSACSGHRSAIFTQERSFIYAWAKYYLQQNTYLNAVIGRSRDELSANEKKGKNPSNDNNNCLLVRLGKYFEEWTIYFSCGK